MGTNEAPVDLSYLADSVVTLRYFESEGEVKQALAVVKKRSGDHEKTIPPARLFTPGDIPALSARRLPGIKWGHGEQKWKFQPLYGSRRSRQ